MKVLWLCNIVLPEFSDIFDIPKSNVGGWLTGMWRELNKRDDIELGICCPIKDEWRMKDGMLNNNKYYSFHFSSKAEYSDEQEIRFVEILNDFKPDIIHIWGTEYTHSMAMVEACENFGLLNRVVVNIQGLVSVVEKYYYAGIPQEYINLQIEGFKSIRQEKEKFQKQGELEVQLLRKVKHVIGRTDWDKACAMQINPDVNYHFCNEILREEFYKHIGEWCVRRCDQHSIFISQASYPVKGLHFLIEALYVVKKKYNDVTLRIAGTNFMEADKINSYGMYIKKMLDKYELNDSIEFIGPLNEQQMCEQYLKANVFVSSSTIENESNSISEAKMLGVPVVASFVGGVISRISHGKDGYLYPYNDIELLAYYLCEVFAGNFKIAKDTDVNNRENNAKINIDIYKRIVTYGYIEE